MSKLAICAALVCATTAIAQSPQLLRDVNVTPGVGANPTIHGPSPRTGELFFVADDGVHGRELWSTDGTAAGTAMVLDMSPGAAGTTHWDTAVAGSRGVLMVERSSVWELWSTDGTAAGTTMLLSASALGAGVFQRPFEELAQGVWAFGVDGVMWRTDGTAAGTFSLGVVFTFGSVVGELAGQKVLQLSTGDVVLTDGTNLVPIANVPGRVHQGPDGRWYSYQNTGSGQSPRTLVTWLDGPGSPGFTVLGYLPVIQLIDGGALIIENQDELKLWSGAGWPSTVVGLQAISGFLAVGDEWAFVATDQAHGRELWLTDGSLAGTRVADLEPGPGSSDPDVFTVLPTGMLMWADIGAIGREPWSVDPATLVATSLGDLEPGAGGSGAFELTPLAGGQRRLLLSYYAPSTGAELAISDGTAVGTQVFDIVPGPQGSVQNLQNMDGMAGPAGGAVVWFSDDGVNGVEPWVMQLPGSGRLERDYGPVELRVSDPVLGGSLDVILRKMAPGQLAVVALGMPVAVGPALLPGRHLHFDALTAFGLAVAVPGPNGTWTGSIQLPNQPSAVGLDAILQPVIVSTSSPTVLDVGPAWWLAFGF